MFFSGPRSIEASSKASHNSERCFPLSALVTLVYVAGPTTYGCQLPLVPMAPSALNILDPCLLTKPKKLSRIEGYTYDLQ